MPHEVKISVLMTAYNAAEYIGEAIRSVLDQSFTDFEFIIINDGSTDDTKQVIRSFSDPRIVLVNQENHGIAASLNTGLGLARTEWIARFDADDICYPDRLERQYNYIRNHPDCIVVGGAADYVDAQGNYVFTSHPPAYTDEAIRKVRKKVCPFVHSSVLYKKEVVIKQGGYNEHAYSFEDHLLWLSVPDEGKLHNLKEPLIKVRLNPASVTIDEKWRPRSFHQIKNSVIRNNAITEEEGKRLRAILSAQNQSELKEGAYYALLAKKYLWNNYQPQKARNALRKVISYNRLDWKSYCFYLLSYLPGTTLQKWYRRIKTGLYS